MSDKDSRLIWEAWDAPGGRPIERGMGSDGNAPEDEIRDRGIHDRPDGGGSLKDFDLEIVASKDYDDDRYWETWEIRATSKAAADQFGHGPIDWIYQSELPFSEEEIEQKVIQSLHNHGKPRFFKPYAEPKSDRGPLLPGEDEERSWQDQPGVYPPGYN